MSLKYIYLLVLGTIFISGGTLLLSLKLLKSKWILNKPKEETVEYFKEFKYLVKIQCLFVLIGGILAFIIYPIRFEAETTFIKIISIISLIYVLVSCWLSVVNYNRFKVNRYKLFIKGK